MTKLSVNVNKVAVLRNSRGGALPDPIAAARCALMAGCAGITVHPRPDQRHVRHADVIGIAAVLGDAEFNIEGNALAPPRAGYLGLLELARLTRPAQVTLVPDGDGQITSDHGHDLRRHDAALAAQIRELKALGCRVSLFVDAGAEGIARVGDYGADRIELYTGPYAAAFARGDAGKELELCCKSASEARAAGLGVNAGHDLDQANLGALVKAIPGVAEVSIGHALFAEALYAGLEATVRSYLRILAQHGH